MTRFLVPAALFTLAVAVVPGAAPACAPAPPFGQRVDVTAETALIVWDEANKVQHFIRRGTFQSTGSDFGFIVPTPHRPELAAADEDVFKELQRITAPAVEVRRSPLGGGCGAAAPAAKSDAMPAGVVVLEQKRVGDYDAAVLAFNPAKGDDPAAGAAELARWLRDHGYAFSPSLTEWLKPYVRDGWVVTAFRIAGQPPPLEPEPDRAATGKGGDARRPGGLRSSVVRMSFKTDRPFFPYREPADQRDEQAGRVPRSLRVYLVGPKRFAGKLGDGSRPWPGRVVWANHVGNADRNARAQLPTGLSDRVLWLTEFEDDSTPRPGTDEVYFEPSADQSPVARPPDIIYQVDPRPWWLAAAGCCGLPVLFTAAVVLGWRRRR